MQVEENIDKILNEALSSIRSSHRSYVRNLLMGEVKEEFMNIFEKTLHGIQDEVKETRRMQDNQLLKEKCKAGPVIHNFTEFEVPEELSKFMEDGLGNVPEMTMGREKVVTEIDMDVKEACRNLFISLVGCHPIHVSMKCSIDSFIKSLIIMAPNNEKLVSSLVAMRENYYASLPAIKKIPHVGNCDKREILKLVPANSILSPSDKSRCMPSSTCLV